MKFDRRCPNSNEENIGIKFATHFLKPYRDLINNERRFLPGAGDAFFVSEGRL